MTEREETERRATAARPAMCFVQPRIQPYRTRRLLQFWQVSSCFFSSGGCGTVLSRIGHVTVLATIMRMRTELCASRRSLTRPCTTQCWQLEDLTSISNPLSAFIVMNWARRLHGINFVRQTGIADERVVHVSEPSTNQRSFLCTCANICGMLIVPCH